MTPMAAGPERGGQAAGLLALLLLCLMLLAAGAAGAEPPRAGLMWNRTGLPAVFPLQVKTPAGRDYFLVLASSGSGAGALAAYAEGGAFFKVLVPPGRYVLRIASGREWQGEAELFGAETEVLELPQPLEFAVRGAGIKAGHLITLSHGGPDRRLRAAAEGQFICQIASLEGPEPALRHAQPGRRPFRLGGDAHARGILHLKWRLGLGGPEPGTPDGLWQRRLFVLGKSYLPRRPPVPQPGVAPLPEPGFRSYAVRSLFCG
ncbi:hypothetical protein [Leisingera thetidis]|uniref:hypothetical protein n=1 Tax=Leisingera thetidis TaxID=2930199 RepID=UPI0021F78A15|nr:hypothetical protein [Leisingera thetidis]